MKKGVVCIVSALAGGFAAAGMVGKVCGNQISEIRKTSDKHLALFFLMNQWVKLKQEKKMISTYFLEHGYKRVAVYGMSYVGKTLIDELKDSEVEIVCGIDRREGIYSELQVVSADEFCEKVDVVVVTAITFFDEIRQKIAEKTACPVISLEDILYELS